MAVLTGVVVLALLDGEYGLPAIVGAAAAIAAGPVIYLVSDRARARREAAA
jgi:hypothetical protein